MQPVNDISLKRVIALNINKLMLEQNKSRKQVCQDLGIKYTTFCDWANGKSTPRIEAIEQISSYFGVEVSSLFIEIDAPGERRGHLIKYAQNLKEINMQVLDNLSENEIRQLLESGFRFAHESLESRIERNGGKLNIDGEYDWGVNPVGREIW